MGKRDAVVLDAERRFIAYVSAPIARRLLKKSGATVLRKDPFTLKLPPGSDALPGWCAVETEMEPTKSNDNIKPIDAVDAAEKRLNARRLGWSHDEYFRGKSDGPVYVQNISDKQISLDIEIGPGQTQGRLIAPSPHPIDLAEEFSFETLKKSPNFRRALGKRRENRPELLLLDAQQYEAYYKALARVKNAIDHLGEPDVDHARAIAADEIRQLTTIEVDGDVVSPNQAHNFKPPKTAQELIVLDLAGRGVYANGNGFESQRMQAGAPINHRNGQIAMTEAVNPKILHLCQQVSPLIPANQQMPFEQFERAILSMQGVMTNDDWQHVESFGVWRKIKTLARQKIAELASRDEGLPDPAPTFAGQRQVAQAQRQGALSVMPVPQGFGPQGPASLAQQQPGMQYAGPGGFANAPFREAYGAAESAASAILGPDGNPM